LRFLIKEKKKNKMNPNNDNPIRTAYLSPFEVQESLIYIKTYKIDLQHNMSKQNVKIWIPKGKADWLC
jgi:hypothetical protein